MTSRDPKGQTRVHNTLRAHYLKTAEDVILATTNNRYYYMYLVCCE